MTNNDGGTMKLKDLISMCDSYAGSERFVIYDNEERYEAGNFVYALAKLDSDAAIKSFGDCCVLRFYDWYCSERVDILIQPLDKSDDL